MKKYVNDAALGAFILASLGILAYMSLAVGGLKIGQGVSVKAEFDNATGLVKDAAVLIAGVNVGNVDSLAVKHDKAVVTLRLRKDAGVRKDVQAAIRAKSLLGEKYVELVPQSETAPAIENGDLITKTTVPVEIDELMTHLGPVIKDIDPKDLRTIVKNVALSLDGNGPAINQAIAQSSGTLTRLNAMLATNETKINAIVSNLEAVTGDSKSLLADNRDEVRRIVTNLDKVSASAPGLVSRLDRITGQTEQLTASLGERGPSLVKNLDATLVKLPKTLDQTDPLLTKLPGTLDTLEKLTLRLDKAMTKLEPLLDQATKQETLDRDGNLRVKVRLF